MHPQFPQFDELSEGLVFAAVHSPVMKLGMIYCMNRPTALYYIKKPNFDKKAGTDVTEKAESADYMKQINPKSEFVSVHPRFSDDYSKLAYVGCEEKFLSHTTNFKLKTITWPLSDTASSETVLPQYEEYPSD